MEKYTVFICLKTQYFKDAYFTQTLIKIPASYFLVVIDKLILKLIWKFKEFRITKTILRIRVRELILSDFKTYHEVREINTV